MREQQPLDVDWLWQQLQQHTPFKRIVVALSGGVDSTVLLHLCKRLHQQQQLPLLAIHVNHQLQSESAAWARHCADLAQQWQLPVVVETVEVERSGHGVESDARSARYHCFESLLQQHDILLQGHHSDDQAETVIMRLMRGSGVRGLAAIPAVRELGCGRVVRPLLEISRQQIMDYANHHKLTWIEDPSNNNRTIERNLIRHEILPLMERQRSGVKQALVRSAEQFYESAELLDQLAASDLEAVQIAPRQLDCAALLQLQRGRCRNLLRYWITSNGLLAPSSVVIDRIIDEGLNSRAEAHPLIVWFGAEVRRYRNHLYLMSRLPAALPHGSVTWDCQHELSLAKGLGSLRCVRGVGGGVRATLLEGSGVSVRWREGGERIQPQGRTEHHTLKNLFQEAGVAPWLRERYPLIYIDDVVAYIPNLYAVEQFAAKKGEAGLFFEWVIH